MDNQRDIEAQARFFLDTHPDTNPQAFRDAFRELPDEVALVVARLEYSRERRELEAEFTPENAHGEPEQTLSPSGKYRLDVTSYKNPGEGFSRTRGVIFRKEGDGWVELQDIKRNYGAFPFLFIEGHASGRSFLVAGEDYQGQTVIELDTGARRTHYPPDAVLGWGFCWANYEYDAASQLLVVDGCLWACPYEFRFYDFSRPMDGWPELEMLDEDGTKHVVFSDTKAPTIEGNIVRCYETNGDEVRAIQTFERVDNRLLFKGEWVSEEESAERKRRAEAEIAYEVWLENLKMDPLYTIAKTRSESLPWPGRRRFGVGVIHKRWCPDYETDETERRICMGCVRTRDLTVEVEWGADRAPIKVDISFATTSSARFFARSTAGMNEALDYVGELVAELVSG